jgi:hypothetical protein
MLEDYYVKLATVDRVRASRLAPQIESYRLEPDSKEFRASSLLVCRGHHSKRGLRSLSVSRDLQGAYFRIASSRKSARLKESSWRFISNVIGRFLPIYLFCLFFFHFAQRAR